METKYYNIAFEVLNYLYLEPDEVNKDEFIQNFNKIMIDDDLTNNLIKELETNLFNLGNDNKGREAYISKNMGILYHNNYFFHNKDLLRSLNGNENMTVREKMIYALFMFLFFIEEYIVGFCLQFDIDFDKLYKRLGYSDYRSTDIFSYFTGDDSVFQLPECFIEIDKNDLHPQQGTPNTPPPPPPPPKQTTFKSLFVAPYCIDSKITELKKILETNGYTIKEQWRGITGKGNELAYLYHFLKSNPRVILTGEFKQQIKVFYNEFGLTVKDKLEPGVICVTKNLQKYSEKTDTYKDFESLFSHWVK